MIFLASVCLCLSLTFFVLSRHGNNSLHKSKILIPVSQILIQKSRIGVRHVCDTETFVGHVSHLDSQSNHSNHTNRIEQQSNRIESSPAQFESIRTHWNSNYSIR